MLTKGNLLFYTMSRIVPVVAIALPLYIGIKSSSLTISGASSTTRQEKTASPAQRPDVSRAEVAPPAFETMPGKEEYAVEVSASVDKHTYRPLEPIRLTITAVNKGAKEIYYTPSNKAGCYERFDLVIRRLDRVGKEVKPTAFYTQEARSGVSIYSSQGDLPYPPGSKWIQYVDANLLWDMTAPGRYSIVVEVPYSKHDAVSADDPSSRQGKDGPLPVPESHLPRRPVARSQVITVEVDRLRRGK